MTQEWLDPQQGFEYLTDEVSVTVEHQHEKLAACGIDPDVFGGDVDPSFFIGLAIHAGIRSGISAEGNINMLQSIVQHRSVLLGEPLTIHGRITGVRAVPRGRAIDTEVTFTGCAGDVAISANRTSLKPDPDKLAARGAGERPAPLVQNVGDLHALAAYALTPDGVRAYSSEGNSIHYDLSAAQKAGFRAPLIGGGMGVHYLMAELWRCHPVRTFSMDIFFRRPVFWDDVVEVAVDSTTSPQLMALVKAEGKVGTELALRELEPV